jgi:glycosyltransferase involved in cell wall biosynthesis
MRIAATGFVSDESGSIASANAMLLRELLRRGHAIEFFSKPSFVDPRKSIVNCQGSERLKLNDCTNHWADSCRRVVGSWGSGIVLRVFERFDSTTYNRGLVKAMRRAGDADIDLWFGDWAHGKSVRPVVSFVQGAPGSDARSVFRHREEIEKLAGRATYAKLACYATWRLNFGLPDFGSSDRVIVGSNWSKHRLIREFGLDSTTVFVIPYPIDLSAFQPSIETRRPSDRLRLLWLGRFVPRKRLGLFLDGLEIAIRQGCDVEAWIVGRSGFVPNYESLLSKFPYQDRLKHQSAIPRADVPKLLSEVDVMAQPSDDEDFGSSVAEALACGVPAIVGHSNGTGDYICANSIRLEDDDPEGFARAIAQTAGNKREGALRDRATSRNAALEHFGIDRLGLKLEQLLVATGNEFRSA